MPYIPRKTIIRKPEASIPINPIKIRISSAWEVKYGNGHRQLLVLDTGFTAIEVVSFLKIYHSKKKFTISAIDAGVFNLDDTIPTVNSYKTDARSMNQNGEITLNFDEK